MQTNRCNFNMTLKQLYTKNFVLWFISETHFSKESFVEFKNYLTYLSTHSANMALGESVIYIKNIINYMWPWYLATIVEVCSSSRNSKYVKFIAHQNIIYIHANSQGISRKSLGKMNYIHHRSTMYNIIQTHYYQLTVGLGFVRTVYGNG